MHLYTWVKRLSLLSKDTTKCPGQGSNPDHSIGVQRTNHKAMATGDILRNHLNVETDLES